MPSGYSLSRAKLSPSGTCGTPGSGGTFWSKRMISAGCSPCRAAISSSGGAQAYGSNPSGRGLALTL